MKLRHVFSVVIGIHLAVVALLFVTPGCQSGANEPSGDGASSGGFTASEHTRHAQNWQTGPVYTPNPSSANSQLYSPSRPSWNVNENNTAAPVSVLANDESIEVLQPVGSSGSATTSAAFGELIPVTGDTGLGSGSVSSVDGGTTYRVQTGDNLTRIASKHGISVGALMAANNLTRETANKIRVNQELVIPASSGVQSVSQTGSSSSSSNAVATSGDVYTVRSGDTLGGIAARHGTSVQALRTANNISGDRINIGQKLRLPSGASASQSAAPRSTAPSTPSSAAPQSSAVTTSGEGYTVRSGETLGGIAARHGTTVQALMAANNISDPRGLRAGQTLRIPGSTGAASSSSSAAPTPRSTTPSIPSTQAPRNEPVPTLPGSFSAPSSGASFSPNSSQGSGDDLLSDSENIPTVQAQ